MSDIEEAAVEFAGSFFEICLIIIGVYLGVCGVLLGVVYLLYKYWED